MTIDPSQRTAPVRSEHSAPLRSEAGKTPHACGANKNLANINNQHKQEATGSGVGDVLQENGGFEEGIAALQRVGVNIVATDLGVHVGRARQLLKDELIQWSIWVRSQERNGISNKVTFDASKILLGLTVGDIFPRPVDRVTRDVGENSMSTNDSEARKLAAEIDRERNRLADTVIASLDDARRQDLRAKALSDPAAWIGRDVSPDVFDRIILSIERRLVLDPDPIP